MTMRAQAMWGCPGETGQCDRTATRNARRLEARRREIMALLEDIRSREPTSADVARVIAQECEDELQGDRLYRLAARIVASFRSR